MFKVLMILLLCNQNLSWDIKSTVATHIKNNYPWARIEIGEIETSNSLPDTPPKSIKVIKGPPGKTVLKLEFENGERATLYTQVRAFDLVVMSRRALRKGHIIEGEDLYLTPVEVDRIPKGALIGDFREAIGKRLVRSIVANTPISEYILENRTKIKRGHRVTIVVNSPNITASTVGELKEDGYVGDYVKVVNVSSRKIIQGILIDENTVEVEY
jgi:flagella basal body P-ring formation protein FlgA